MERIDPSRRIRGAILTILAAAVVFTVGYQFPDQFPDVAESDESDRWNAWLQIVGFGGSAAILLARTLRWTWLGRAIVWVFLGATCLYLFIVSGPEQWAFFRTRSWVWGMRSLVSFGMLAYLAALITGEVMALRDRMRFRASVSGIPSDRLAPDVILAALAAAAPIIVADESGSVLYATASIGELVGAPVSTIEGRSITALMPNRYRTLHTNGLNRFIQTGESSIIGRVVRVELLRRDGEEVPIHLALATATVGGRRYFVGSLWRVDDEVNL